MARTSLACKKSQIIQRIQQSKFDKWDSHTREKAYKREVSVHFGSFHSHNVQSPTGLFCKQKLHASFLPAFRNSTVMKMSYGERPRVKIHDLRCQAVAMTSSHSFASPNRRSS
jgi:hypothetical protein